MTTVVRLRNQINDTLSDTADKQGISLTLDVKQWEDLSGGSSEMNPPSRQVPTSPEKWYEIPFDKHESAAAITHVQESALQTNMHGAIFENPSNMCSPQDTITVGVIEDGSPSMLPQANNKDPHVIEAGGIEQPPLREVLIDLEADSMNSDIDDTLPDTPLMINKVSPSNEPIFTCHTDPFKPERVAKILAEVQIGSDITPEQRRDVLDLVERFADCFALAISEVNTVPGAIHKLDIPTDATFRTKIGQRALNAPQKAFIHSKVSEMLAAGIIEPIHPRDVRAVAPTVLAKKTHDGQGLSLDKLKHLVNDQCVENGIPGMPDLPPCPTSTSNDGAHTDVKWRMCQDFGEINKVTEIAPMPQGDIRAKQQRLSGHQYIHVFDFAASFYAVSIHPDSQPYITFYVEGWGYFKYLRLLFGVTGGPSEFAQLTGERMHDLTADGMIELFVDDGGSASDTFEEGMQKLKVLLERVRQERLSLSPSKLRLFMTEAVFAGATVGPNGVSPDLSKLTAIVNWSQPQDASHLEGFLGLSGYFRDLIKGYSIVEKPLRDILRAVDVPKGLGKQGYQRIMRNYKLTDIWKPEHTKAFLDLKRKLVSEPVLQAPQFDGTPFILTTDGSKDAFAGVLSQKVTTILPGGKKVIRLHPLGYASKRTSSSEEKYKPFLLEFAALKFCFDKFTDILWGFPVEVEIDCQALRDVLLSENLNATHARWRDGVMAHNIVGVRHVPGVVNTADGLSRQYEGLPKGHGDGSEWSVSPDLDDTTGVVHDILQVEISDEHAALRNCFNSEPVFSQVIDALLEMDHGTRIRERMRARHHALNYSIADGKLWFVGGGTGVRARARRECVTRVEAVELARKEHIENGHFHRDSIKISLLDKIQSPKLDQSIVTAIMTCARCKGFGGTHLHSLLNPITRRHPFELLVGDYLSLPEGKGGFQTVGLYLDTASQHV
jgi:RNase H-like domain found in reverse transcriptase